VSRLIPLVALALICSLAAVCWKTRGDLQAASRELLAVTTANDSLRKTLGDMTVAITAKDKEIDRLAHAGCDGQEKARPGVPMGAKRSKVSESDAARPGTGERIASAESVTK
jgi:hypothetical protein